MKIQFLVDRFKKGVNGNENDYWEDAETTGNETPEECAKRIVDNFNRTLRSEEEHRTVVEVRMAPEKNSAYAWWDCRLTLECPYCEAFLNLNDSSEFPELHDDRFPFPPGKSMNEDDLKYQDIITCPDCEKEFKLEGIGY